MPSEAKKTNSSAKTSDQLVEELLEDIKNRDKNVIKDKDEKGKKHHKHKKEKKKKHKHRSRSREKKSRKRSRSGERKKNRKRKHRDSSASALEQSAPDEKRDKHDKERSNSLETSERRESHSPAPSCSSIRGNDEDDDLPVGADFQTVLSETRKDAENADASLPPLNLSELPCEPGQSHRKSNDSFPLAKGKTKETEPAKKEHEILKKVIETKGPGDFVPRNVKVKKDKPEEKTKTNETKKSDNDVAKEKKNGEKEKSSDQPKLSEKKSKEAKEKQEDVLKNASNKEWEFSIKSLPPKPGEKEEKTPKKEKHKHDAKASKSDIGSRRKASLSPKRSKKNKKRSRSRDRRKSRSRSPIKEKRRRSLSRSRRSRSRSLGKRSFPARRRRSWSRGRRSFGRAWSRGRSSSRTWSRSRSRSRSWSRGRSRSRDRIDKAKLLEIARKRRAQGIFDIGDENPKSVEDFVSYCEKLQRRQDKEDRRARGEVVSDNDSDIATPAFKHPYKQVSDPIRINIVNAVPLPIKSTEENILDSAALRVVYPVSSGNVHRENTEWKAVEKEPIPMTCSAEQKKFRALTTLEKEKVRQKAAMMGQTAAYFLPPPPAPPALPPPPVAPVLSTAFDTLAPPPAPLPATLIIPPEKEMIMKEPEDVTTVPPRNVADVLARRAKAQRKLQEDPNDFKALRDLKDANEQMNAWAAVKSIPGKYTGSTGINILTPEELQPHDPRYNAWVKKDMFKQLVPAFTNGIGLRLMSKMGWRPGLGLGREGTGNVEPLTLDVKNDRKGLATEEEMPNKGKIKNFAGTDLSGKHPVSLVMELCAKRRWAAPEFTCLESGPAHQREFIWRVVVNGTEYTSATSSKNKKDGKSVACQVVLQAMGLVPADHSQPVVI